jgi:5-methylcytosine-specific restriction enzyme subunit McrC
MKHICIFDAFEHGKSTLLNNNFNLEELKEIDKTKNNKYLAISRQTQEIIDEYQTGKLIQPRAGYFIGYRWFKKNKSYIKVTPKLDNNRYANYLEIFLMCLEDPIVSKTIRDNPKKLYQIFFDEPLINIENQEDKITPFLIIHFLQLVKNIHKKGLKKDYIKVKENLTCKTKGKILVNQTIKQNHFKNRIDKTVCSHQVYTINCIENQILKTALIQCKQYIQNINDENIELLLKQNMSAFEFVDYKKISNNDFHKIRYSSFFKEYKEALKLAKMIFQRFGFALDHLDKNIVLNKIPPYYINMPELFERYVEVKLRESFNGLIDGNYEDIAYWGMRPDFLLPVRKMIIDAKYKYWFKDGKNNKGNENSEYKNDYMQLSLYGRDLKIRKKLGLTENESNNEIELLFIYPTIEKDINNSRISLESYKFNKIKKFPLYIPTIKVTNKLSLEFNKM